MHFSSRKRTAAHVRISPEGNLTCATVCPSKDAQHLTCIQIRILWMDGEGFLCSSCGEVFSVQWRLDTHLTKVHNIVTARAMKYSCPECSYICGKQAMLDIHIDRVHRERPPDKSIVCDLCGQGFYFQDEMTKHKNRHHFGKKRYKCQFCSKDYFLRAHWQTHTKQHLGEVPHQCKWCHQGFCSAYALKVHERIHTGEKPYECQQCGAAFAQKNSIDVHMKKHQRNSI